MMLGMIIALEDLLVAYTNRLECDKVDAI